MSDQGELYAKSWILFHILDRFMGSREIVAVRRRLIVLGEQLRSRKGRTDPTETFYTGSRAEGMHLKWSDADAMCINKNVIVTCPDNYIFSDQLDSANKTILIMRDASSRPGYVNLELLHLGQRYGQHFQHSIIQVGDVYFISSEIYKLAFAEVLSEAHQTNVDINGPAVTLRDENSSDLDQAISFPCYNWPSEANEWMSRPRLSGWPNKALRDQIVQGGCHLVPVGDKTSGNPFLQWRISFTTAERKLIYTLTQVQFLVYALLKYFLKQISGMLKQMLGEADILSSYILKTVIFHAVEITAASFWQEKHTFLCFMLCLKILINWVKAGHCPNYFIKNNNMFLGKVQGENQRKLLRFLTDLHDMKWGCLSVGTFLQPTIGDLIYIVRQGPRECVLPPPAQSENERDFDICHNVNTSLLEEIKRSTNLSGNPRNY
ncbi:uncharacterized protein LOC110463422 [Mizuhopecten yessoensis]|uniref:uncharacterized protein LOC110463422 n=1 Tax=Mizuhopecten yessoensis TaxID=6573 RepID=UPI000B458333|nr:uncharacterized protein LOC110463422 [Mizuhopecten yessoensis]